MRSLYATRLTVRDTSLKEIAGELEDWIEAYYAPETEVDSPQLCEWAWTGGADGLIVRSESWTPKESHEIESQLRGMNWRSLYEVTWSRPSDSPGVDQRQTLDIAVLNLRDHVEFDLRSSLSADTFRVQPLDPGVIQRPRIIDRLVQNHDCWLGESRVFPYPQRIDVGSARAFLHDTLAHPDRTVPVVLVSHDSELGRPIRDPEWVQNRLLGLAIVAEITPSAEEPFTEEVGRSRTCTGGDVRLYWPGFTPKSVPKEHPYFSVSFIEKQRAAGTDLEDILFERVTRVATERHRQSQMLRLFRRDFRQERRAELLRATEESSQDVPEDWMHEYENVLVENDRLHQEVEELENELQVTKKNLRAVYQETATPEKDEIEDTTSRQEVSSLVEALDFAEEKFGEHIYIWKSAWTAAENTQYHDPPEIVDVLEAVARLAEEYKEKEGAVGPWREHFQEWGLKFARHESEPTMNQYGEHRKFHDGDRQSTMQTHVTIGQGHKHCLQIYFDRLDGDSRFQIGYCGEHFPYASEST